MRIHLQWFQSAIGVCLYRQNFDGNPFRTSFLPNMFLVIRFLQLALLNTTQIESQKVLSSLFQIVRLSDITHIQFLNVYGIMRVSLWIIYSLLFLSQVLYFIVKSSALWTIKGQKSRSDEKTSHEWAHWRVFVINFCDSFQLIVERILFIPTLQFLFYSNSPTTAEGVAAVSMRNNRSFGLGIQALFFILFIVSTIRSVSTRLGVHSFAKLLEDRTLERNQLFSILEPVAITLLVWISGLVREANLSAVTLDSCLIVFGFLIVVANLGWQTFAHSNTHALLGKLATLLISHSIMQLIVHVSESKDNYFSVIYFITLPFALKMYTNLHMLIFKYDDTLRLKQKLSWFQSLQLHRMIRTTAEKTHMKTEHADGQLALAEFMASDSYSNETDYEIGPPSKEKMSQDQIVQRLLLKTFKALSNQKRVQSLELILDFACYEMFYAKKPVTACLHISNYIRKSTGSLRKMILQELLDFAQSYLVAHMSHEEREQYQRKFYDGIKFDQLHKKIKHDIETIKVNYSNFYSLLIESNLVSLDLLYKKGRTHFKLIQKTSNEIERLILLNPSNVEGLNLKLYLRQNIIEDTGAELKLLKTNIDILKQKNAVLQKGSNVNIDLSQMNSKYYYIVVDIVSDIGRIAHCSHNLLTDFGYAGKHDDSNLNKLHLSAILPPNVAEVHDNILKNFAYTINDQIGWQRLLPSVFARTCEGYIVPVSVITRFEIINSQIYSTATMKHLHTKVPTNHIMITRFGKIVSYSKGLTQSLLNFPPVELVANFNICFFIPELTKYLFDDYNDEKLFPKDNETEILNLIFYDFSKVSLIQRELVEFQNAVQICEKDDMANRRQLRERWNRCYEWMQQLQLDTYQVSMKIIKKDYTKHNFSFKAIEIYRIKPILAKDKLRKVMGTLKSYLNVKKILELESTGHQDAVRYSTDTIQKEQSPKNFYFSKRSQEEGQSSNGMISSEATPTLRESFINNKQVESSMGSSRVSVNLRKESLEMPAASSQASGKSKGAYTSIKRILWERQLAVSALAGYTMIAAVCATILLSLLSYQFWFNYSNTHVLLALTDYMEKPFDMIKVWEQMTRRVKGVALSVTKVTNRTQMSQWWSERSGPFSEIPDSDRLLLDTIHGLWNSTDSWGEIDDYIKDLYYVVRFPNNMTVIDNLPEIMLQAHYYTRDWKMYKKRNTVANQKTRSYRWFDYNELLINEVFGKFLDYIIQKKTTLIDNIFDGNTTIVILSFVASLVATLCCLLIYSKIRLTKMKILALFCRIPKASLLKEMSKFSDSKSGEKKKISKEHNKSKERLFINFNSNKGWIVLRIPIFFIVLLALNSCYLWLFGSTHHSMSLLNQGIQDYQIMKNSSTLNQIALANAYNFFAAIAYEWPENIETDYQSYMNQSKLAEAEMNRFNDVMMLFGTPRGSDFYPASVTQMFETSRDSSFCQYLPSPVIPFCLNSSIQNITSTGIIRSMKFVVSELNQDVQTIYYSSNRLSQLKSIGFTENFMLLDDLRIYTQNFQSTTTAIVKENVFAQIYSSISYLKTVFIGLCVLMTVGMGVGWALFVRKMYFEINKTARMLAILPQSVLIANAHIRTFIINDLRVQVI